MQKKIPVVILCGGYGTRLGMGEPSKPKALVQIGNRPIIWHVMKIYARYGYDRFILCLGYEGFQIKEYFLNYRYLIGDFKIRLDSSPEVTFLDHAREDWDITFAETGIDTNTGGRIKRVERYIDTDYFLATYSDGLSDVNIGELVEYHLAQNRVGTMTGVNPMSSFGVLKMDPSGTATGFREKPQQEEWINGGFFVFDRRFFGYLDEHCVLEKEPLERIAREGQLAVFKHRGFWKCMDTFKDAQTLNQIWKSSPRPPWDITPSASEKLTNGY